MVYLENNQAGIHRALKSLTGGVGRLALNNRRCCNTHCWFRQQNHSLEQFSLDVLQKDLSTISAGKSTNEVCWRAVRRKQSTQSFCIPVSACWDREFLGDFFSLSHNEWRSFLWRGERCKCPRAVYLCWAHSASQALCKLSIMMRPLWDKRDRSVGSHPALQEPCFPAVRGTPRHLQHREWEPGNFLGLNIRNKIDSSIYPAAWKRCKSTDIAIFQNLEVS